MFKRLRLLIFLLACFSPAGGFCQTLPHVLVLPFEILAQQERSYLQTQIPEVIKNQLKQDGAIIVDMKIDLAGLRQAGDTDADLLRRAGIRSGADFVISGSLTWIGKKFSLDTRMVEAHGSDPPFFFYKEGESIENLPGLVRDVSRDIALKLFRREKVVKVQIEGNQRIEVDAISRIIKTKPGDVYLAKSLAQDLKAVYAMGYFDDIRIEAEEGPEGKTIIFKVKEKPTIRYIRISQNNIFDDEKIKEALSIKTGSILNTFQVQNNVERIKDLYKEKNYHNIKVDTKIHEQKNNQADLEFILDEGVKLRVEKIRFIGNAAYTEKKLKSLMKTSEKGFFSWFTDSGDLKMEDLNQDTALIAAFYQNNGYIQVKVSDPQVAYKETWIEVEIKIDEGQQFKVGQVDVTGDLIFPREVLNEKLKITKEVFYNREVIRKDVLDLNDLYADEGYAYANIVPQLNRDLKTSTVNITYQIDKGKQVFFERIVIGGNTKTRDKVIRRQLQVYEQGLYSGSALKKGVRSLYRLDFFEDVKVNTNKGSADDKMVLKIDVTEKPTGAFSFGGGYSTVETLFFQASIVQRNLFGRGQVLGVKAEIGGRSSRYSLSFTEPWLFDIPLSAGGDLYNWVYDYDTYLKASMGGRVRFSYPIFEFTRVHLNYRYDRADIKDVTENASDDIKDLEGVNITSSVYSALSYDSRDKIFNPTEGSKHQISAEYAGLGGNIGYTKLLAETGWYIPLVWKTVGFLHAEGGHVVESGGKTLPDYERFYLGGINSLRGFGFQDIYVLDKNGDKIGGNKYIQMNVELILPLIAKAGLVGVLFYDTGNVYGSDETVDLGGLRQSVGYGIRWYSPMGPMRLECGYILNPEPGEQTGGRWEFSMGGAF